MAKLITGGLGFIGSHLARKLVELGEEVVLLDVIKESRSIADIKNKVTVVQADLGNWAQILEVIKQNKIKSVFHTAALLSAAAEASPLSAYTVNANGTFHILEAARLFEVETVVFLSSIATFGPGLPARVGDDTVQRPTTMYGVTKVFSERLGEYYNIKFGINFRGLRFPSIIGPGRGGGGASAYSSLMIQEPAAGRPYDVFVDKETAIPLLYIEDAVAAMLAMEKTPEKYLKRRMYNIEGFSPAADRIAGSVKQHLPSASIRFRPDPEMVKIVDSWPRELDGSNACRDWGWRTQYDLDKAVAHFINEVQASMSPASSPPSNQALSRND
jgi:threonine 3-dehydrogenase